jgi:hypothetical protein
MQWSAGSLVRARGRDWAAAPAAVLGLIRDPEVAQKVFVGLRGLAEADDGHLYFMAPTPEAKGNFAAWVTDPARPLPENFDAFEVALSHVKDLLARQGKSPDQRWTV